MNFRMDSESEIRNISKDVEQKWGASEVRWGGVRPRRGVPGQRLPENGGGPVYTS